MTTAAATTASRLALIDSRLVSAAVVWPGPLSSCAAAIHRRVSRDIPIERAGGARPVADAPVDALVARAEELARRWAISLVASRPLSQMADVPLHELAREAPELCAQLVRALGSDAELARMLEPPASREGGGADRVDALAAWIAPARDATSAVRDVEALRGVVWDATLGELSEPAARQVADLSDRLAFICASLLGAVLARNAPAGAGAGAGVGAAQAPGGPERGGREQVRYTSSQSSPGGRRAVLIDERGEARPAPARAGAPAPPTGDRFAEPSSAGARAERRATSPGPAGTAPAQTVPRARPWDTPLNAGREAPGVDPPDAIAQPAAESEGADPVLRVTRGPGSRVDGRA
jgi:hypothetical protein